MALKHPTSKLMCLDGREYGEKVEAVMDVLGFEPDVSPSLDLLTEATIILELATTLLFARYCETVQQFTMGIVMFLRHVTEDAQIIRAENESSETE